MKADGTSLDLSIDAEDDDDMSSVSETSATYGDVATRLFEPYSEINGEKPIKFVCPAILYPNPVEGIHHRSDVPGIVFYDSYFIGHI
jgi:hypothetical protein